MDPLEIPETAERASWYGVVSHPHVRFDGILFDIGATSCDQVEQDYRDLIEQRLADTGGMSPVEITGGYDVGDTDVSIEATFRLVDPVDLTDLRASLLIYENDVFYCCGYGGVDTWPVVTRRIHDEEIVLQNVDDEVVVSADIPIDPEWDPDMLHVVAYLQNTATKEVIQGLYVEPSPAGVDDLIGRAGALRIDRARPTPFRQATEIAFTIPGISRSSTCRAAGAPRSSRGPWTPASTSVAGTEPRPRARPREAGSTSPASRRAREAPPASCFFSNRPQIEE
ncbi:MAG: hypothetical protein GF346_06975 [Candidatus Eisenbacteria bacterium]|nr:hypothetical protein [Candidatus Latescibacterota bacterium]MBD3302172.1 hypothetical protein [Candidatus Eisenbacteria bacterium]